MRTRRAAALVAAALLILAACDDGEPRSTPEREGPRATPEPEGPRERRGTVTFGVLGEPSTLDPYGDDASDLSYFLARPVYRSLFRVAPAGEISGDLVDMSDPGTLRAVRGGVVVTLSPTRWSDGTSLTARDVVRSVERARPPSGFVGLEATALDRHRLRLTGSNRGDWARRLAVGTMVTPPGRPLRVGTGPFVVDRYVPGLEISYVPNPEWDGDRPGLNRITVRFIASVEIMLKLLESGRLDAAAVPSAVNIDDRLDELDLAYATSLGWETVGLDLEQVPDRDLRAAVIAAVDRRHIAEGVIRDEGAAVEAAAPRPDAAHSGIEIQLGTAAGDELLVLVQRIIQRDLAAKEIKAELVTIDPATLYGPWESTSPLDVALRREVVPAFGRHPVPRDLSWFPMFAVDSFIAWSGEIYGFVPNGTLDGPLWNAEEWSKQ